jgi:hypothetical protein
MVRGISLAVAFIAPELRLLEHPARAALSLYQASANGEKSPEGWAATRIRAALEQLELASRPEVDRSAVRAKDHGCVCRLLVGFEFGCAVLKRGIWHIRVCRKLPSRQEEVCQIPCHRRRKRLRLFRRRRSSRQDAEVCKATLQ